MTTDRAEAAMESLAPLAGEWRMEAVFPPTSPAAGMELHGVARTTFEYLPGRQFVIQRWEVPHEMAPDGVAVIGFDDERGLVQHYFDSRGVSRLYDMTVDKDEVTFSRTTPDFSPLDFAQRFTATISADGNEILGRWELATEGTNWAHDFELNYRKVLWRPATAEADLAPFTETARHIIDTNVYMTLATAGADGTPSASPVWFAHDVYREFFWVSRPDVRHSTNIAHRSQVGIVIFDSTASNADAQGVYIDATAELVADAERERAIEIISRRSEARGSEAWTLADVTEPSELRVYRAAACEHFVLGATDRRIPVPGV